MKLKFTDKLLLVKRFEALCSPIEMNPAAEKEIEGEKQRMIYEAILEVRDVMLLLFLELSGQDDKRKGVVQ